MNIQDWFPLWLTGLIFLLSKGLSVVFSSITVWRHRFSITQPFLFSSSHIHTGLEKTIALTIQIFVIKATFLLFNMLSRLDITFLPRSKRLLISWLQSPSAVILEPQKTVCHCFHWFPIYLLWSDETRCHDLCFLNVEFEANFFTLLFHQEAL